MNPIRRALAAGEPSLGIWCQVPTPTTAELLAAAGFPWLAFDLQHGTAGWHDALGLIQAAELGGAVPVVRLASGDPADVMRALDDPLPPHPAR